MIYILSDPDQILQDSIQSISENYLWFPFSCDNDVFFQVPPSGEFYHIVPEESMMEKVIDLFGTRSGCTTYCKSNKELVYACTRVYSEHSCFIINLSNREIIRKFDYKIGGNIIVLLFLEK